MEIEAEGDYAAIAGKKLYAVFDKGKVLKKASKGCRARQSNTVILFHPFTYTTKVSLD
jgi:hypothetical protein